MAWQPDYVTSAQLKAHLRITDSADDAAVDLAVTAASRAIDKYTNRQFGQEASAVARYFRYEGECIDGLPAIAITDLATTVDLVMKLDTAFNAGYATTLTVGTDFDFWPYNAALDGLPWTHMVFRSLAPVYPAGYSRELQGTAKWGWAQVPAIVQQACLIQAARFFVRRDSSYGIAGSPEAGNELRLLDRLDPDVALSLTVVRRHWGAVGGC